ncbi:MAG TPA: hypothetical protein VFE62_17975 [Gemmataceae bacterium]|nr:hypothetical protein [Gemmataceae bacterium]
MSRTTKSLLASVLTLITAGAFAPVQAQWHHHPNLYQQQVYQQQMYQQMMLRQQILRTQMLQEHRLYQLQLQQRMYQQMQFQPPVVQPVDVPPTSIVPQPYANQAGPKVQVYSGRETLAGYGSVTFRLFSNGKAVMVDAKETMNGTWARNNDTITLTFGGGNIVYTGTLDGQNLSGNATDGRDNWSFSVSRQ